MRFETAGALAVGTTIIAWLPKSLFTIFNRLLYLSITYTNITSLLLFKK